MIRAFLDRLVEQGRIDASAFAVVEAGTADEETTYKVVVVSSAFESDPIEQGKALWVAAWNTDPRITPYAASASQWEQAQSFPMLARFKKDGRIVRID